MRTRDEVGHVTLLALGLAMVVFAVAGLAVDGTRAFLAQRSLQNVADAAAVASAGSIDRDIYYASGGGVVELDEMEARKTAARVLARRGLPADVGFVARDGDIQILVRSTSRTTFLRLVGVTEIPVAAAAVAAPFAQVVPADP